MNIALLQSASGPMIEGPVCRVPFGNYRIEKQGSFSGCYMKINDDQVLDVNSKLILSNNSSIKMFAENAEDLTVRFIREK